MQDGELSGRQVRLRRKQELRRLTRAQRRQAGKPKAGPGAPPAVVTRHQVTVSRAVIEPESLRWFVLRCEPRKDESAVRVLDRHGIPAAIPTTPRERRLRGRIYRWRTPVMPGYVLVGFPGEGEIPWWDVMRFGVLRSVVTVDGRPAQVPWRTTYTEDGEVRRGGVERLLADLEAIRTGAAKYLRRERLAAGGRVRIEAGPFAGFEGRLADMTDGEATVLVDLFGRLTPVRSPVDDLAEAAA